MPHDSEIIGTEIPIISDRLWRELDRLTGGAANPCYQCGACTATCPWGLVKRDSLSPHRLLRQAQMGLEGGEDGLWLCTTCAQCETYCPRGVPVLEVVRGIRYLAWEQRRTPRGLPTMLWSVYWNNNPWTQPPSHRSRWTKDLSIPKFDPQEHEITLYIGCTASYDSRAGKIAHALVRLLDAAKVAYGTLGVDEPCCGEAVLSVGHKPYFQDIARNTANYFHDVGVSRLVTISPHCYDAFKKHYTWIRPGVQPVHYTQYLAELIANGRLTFEHPLQSRVTFHDPCYLSRHNGEPSHAREVLRAIPGLDIVEMEHAGPATLCCGGGGGRMWMETEPGERFADLRIREASATGAEVLTTACPFCLTCLEDSLKAQRLNGLAVYDIAEIAGLALAGRT